MRVYKCDRCGADICAVPMRAVIYKDLDVADDGTMDIDEYDLCNDCAKLAKRFLRGQED